MCLGFALGKLSGNSSSDATHTAILCAAKLCLAPLLYVASGRLVGCAESDEVLGFLGSLPASTTVYSLALTRQLSPSVVGPLVPLTILLSVLLSLMPLSPLAVAWRVSGVVRLALVAVAAMAAVTSRVPSPHSSRSKAE